MAFEFPIYKATLLDDADEIDFNALVDRPAHSKKFETFAGANEKRVRQVFDDEQMIVRGVAIAANLPIYRYDPKTGQEYYIYFDKEEIKKMGQRMSERGYFNNVNEMHDSKREINNSDLTFMEVFYVDYERGLNPPTALADQNLQDGSMIISYKIKSRELWNKIKDGTYYGFSVEGWFTLVRQNFRTKQMNNIKAVKGKFATISEIAKWDISVDQESIEEGTALTVTQVLGDGETDTYKIEDGEYMLEDGRRILVDADGIVRLIFKAESKNKNKMSKKSFIDRIKAKLNGQNPDKEKMGEALTTDGATIVFEGDAPREGETLSIRNEEGDEILAPEGTHTVNNEDGSTWIIEVDASGVIASVEVIEEDGTEIEEMEEAIEEMAATMGALKTENESLKKENEELKKSIEDASKKNEEALAEMKKKFTEDIEALAEVVDGIEFSADGSGRKRKGAKGEDKPGYQTIGRKA